MSKLSSSCLYKLCRTNRIKQLLSRKTLILVLNAIIFSRRFNCSTVWSNTSQKNTDKLQLIQNFACRIVLGLKKYDRVCAVCRSLGWFSVRDQQSVNIVNMMHKCRKSLVPSYLCNLFQNRFSVTGRNTRNHSYLMKIVVSFLCLVFIHLVFHICFSSFVCNFVKIAAE